MKWHFKSIRSRLIFIMLLTIALPIMISSTLLYFRTRQVVMQNEIEQTESLFIEGKRNIGDYFDSINKISLEMYREMHNNVSFFTVVNQYYDEYSDEFISRAMTDILQFDKNIFQVYLYLEGLEKSFLIKDYLVVSSEKGIYFDNPIGQKVFLSDIHKSDQYNIEHMNKNTRPVISFRRNLYDIPSYNRVGQLSIDIHRSVLEELCQNLYEPNLEELVWINLTDESVYFSSEDRLYSKNDPLIAKAVTTINNKENYFWWKDDMFEGLCIVETMSKPYLDSILIKKIPNSYINDKVNSLTKFSFWGVLIATFIIILVSILISYYATIPIGNLLYTMNEIRNGNLDASITIKGEDEFAKLQGHFNEMMDSINEHIDVEFRLVMENTFNELRALQSQINSHFMNNILQSIGTLALKGENKKAYQLIVKLGNMMQYSMRNQKQLVPLKDELEYCQYYLDLQVHRFDGKIEYILDVEEHAKDILVPKMVLQPIIENCFTHGFLTESEAGKIVVRGFIVDERLHIIIEDNGVGMDQDKTDLINKKLVQSLQRKSEEIMSANKSYERIGLNNVYKRIHFYYKGLGKMKIVSEKGLGTKVQINIPLEPLIRGGVLDENVNRRQ